LALNAGWDEAMLALRGSFIAFTPEQLQALALMFLKLNAYAFDIYLVFFGFWCVLIGYLIFQVDVPASSSGGAVGDQWFERVRRIFGQDGQ
jgi:hypothetical protein